MTNRAYYVYIMTNHLGTLYTGVTNNIETRVWQHREGKPGTFTGRYRIRKLIYVEEYVDVRDAIAREKEIKGWSRTKKLALIRAENPAFRDYFEDT